MQPLKNLIVIARGTPQPVYLQIADQLIHHIRRGKIRKGVKLPGSREMADMLNINRSTVRTVYDELEAQGWIERISRKGTFVNRNFPDIKPEKVAEEGSAHFPEKPAFSIYEERLKPLTAPETDPTGKLVINDGFPDIRLAPVKNLMRAMRSIAGRATAGKYLGYGSPQGVETLCEILASHLSDTRGLPVTSKNLMITGGAQMGFFLATTLLIQPGDQVIVGEPGYFGANRTFLQQGAVLNRVQVDKNGIDVDAVKKICERKKIKMLYVIPHHHHPTTVTLTPERRIRLLELAATYKFAIIEDDYDYDFHYASSPMLPMASLDEFGSVIYIGTLTKTVAPGIRIGFMTGAEKFIQAASSLRRTVDWQGNPLLEAAIAELYKDGTIARHIRKSVRLYHKRRDHFCRLLETTLGDYVSFDIPHGGISVWVKFNRVNLQKLSQKAATEGLVISDGRIYNTHQTNYNAARLGFASLNMEEQKKVTDILKKCILQF